MTLTPDPSSSFSPSTMKTLESSYWKDLYILICFFGCFAAGKSVLHLIDNFCVGSFIAKSFLKEALESSTWRELRILYFFFFSADADKFRGKSALHLRGIVNLRQIVTDESR